MTPDTKLNGALADLLAAGAPGALALAVGPSGRQSSAAGKDASGRTLRATAQFEIGSIAKTFLAALVLTLAEDGAFELDDDVTAHLPAGYEAISSINMRSLLNHTSGLPDFFEDPSFAAAWRQSPTREWDAEELIGLALALPRHEPGVFSYANSNYLLLGLAVESVTGATFGELLRRRILDPHGLTATGPPATASVPGALVSSADDLARFLEALISGKIIEEASLREMLETVPSNWEESQGYGLGIERVESLMGFDASPCGSAWGHVGLGQATTVAFTTPDGNRQVVLMAGAMLTSDAAWAALSRATWAALCP